MLEIRLLGGFQVLHDGNPVEGLEPSSLQSLLAYLLVGVEKSHLRRHLAFTFWPDSTEKQAFTNLRNQLHRLRSALPDPDSYLEADRTHIAWRPESATEVDVWHFDRAYGSQDWARAVDLYRGNLLPGLYDEWILAERDLLRDRFLQSVENLISAQESSGELRLAVATARKLLRHDPLNEPTYRRLMRLYQALGDRASAVAAYQTCVDVLQNELGARPSAETEAAYQDLISRDQPPTARPPERTQRPRHNLPAPLSSFIGRDELLEALKSRLQNSRVLTLTGPAGVGKTRLAQELAHDQLDTFPEGVWWVDLAPLVDREQIVSATASAVGLRAQADEPMPDRLLEFLQPKSLLVALDNGEHVLPAVQELTSSWLQRAPSMKVLLTSREPLHFPGEAVQPVEPLSLPPEGAPGVEAIETSEAGKLFLERARALLPTFRLTQSEAEVVAEICRRLDGIPLAIELAAGQIRTLTPPEIAQRLDDALTVLATGSPAAPERQRTLHQAVDWSYQLLSDSERRLLRRLAVFSGGWTLEAAEFVASSSFESGEASLARDEVLPTLSGLLEKSLVHVKGREQNSRYAMLEIVRLFAREKLMEAAEGEAARKAHLAFFLDLARRSYDALVGPEQFIWFDRLRHEIDNFRSALQTGLDISAPQDGMALAVHLGRFWTRTDRFREGLRWIDAGLERIEPTQDLDLFAQAQFERANLLYGLGEYDAAADATGALHGSLHGHVREAYWKHRAALIDGRLLWRQGKYDESSKALEEASRALREHGEPWGAADAIHIHGHVLLDIGETDSAVQAFTRSLKIYREIGDSLQIAALVGDLGLAALFDDDLDAAERHFNEALEIYENVDFQDGMARSLNRLGDIARCRRDYTQAEELYRRSLGLAERIQYRAHMISAEHNLGYCALARDDIEGAARAFENSMDLAEALDDRKGVVEAIVGLASATADRGQPAAAIRFYAATKNLAEELGARVWPANHRETEPRLAELKAALPKAEFEEAWDEGQSWTLAKTREEAKQQLERLRL